MKWHREWFIHVPWGKLALTNEPLPYGEPNYVVFFEKPPKPATPFINFNKFIQQLVYTQDAEVPVNTSYGPKLMRFHFLYAMELAVRHLGWDRFIFVGHSMGCEQGLFYNVIHPGQISKMILLDAGPTLMRMQIEDNAEYYSLFYNPTYEKYKRLKLGDTITFKDIVAESMQRKRDLSHSQCDHLLSRNFTELEWHPIQTWHPNEIRIVARKIFLVSFDDDQDTKEQLLPNGTRTMVFWILNENDIIKLDDDVVLKQNPFKPLCFHVYGEKVNLVIRLTKNAHIGAIMGFPVDPTRVVPQDANEENSDENESIDEQSSVGGDSNNHDIPTRVPKDLGLVERVFYLRLKTPSGTSKFEVDETQSPGKGKSNEAQSDNNGCLNKAQGSVEEESNEAKGLVAAESDEAQGLVEEESNEAQGLVEEESNEVEGLVEEKSNEAQGLFEEESNEAEGLVEEKSNEVEGLVEEKSNEAQGLVEEESNEAEGLVEEESNEAEGLVEEESNEAEGLVEEKSNEVEGLVEEKSNEAQGLVEEESNEAEGLVEEESNEAEGLVEEKSNEVEGLVEEKSNEVEGLVEEKSNEAQGLVEEESNEAQGLLEKKSNEVKSSVEGIIHTQGSGEASVNYERSSSNKISIGVQTSNKKRYYYCDFYILYSRLFENLEITEAYTFDDLGRIVLEAKNRRISIPKYTVSTRCECYPLILIPDEDFNGPRSPSEGLRSNRPLGLDEAESSNGAQNTREDHESEDLSLIANANCVAENPEPSNAIQAQSSNEAHGSKELPNVSEAQNGNDSPKLPRNGNGSRDGEESNEPDGSGNPNRPQNANGRDNLKSKVAGYLSWDNRLKNLAPQNYGNDYYFELFKSIPPTLLVAASDGAKNVPPIPKWRQGAKELLDKMATLDNFHRVDVEGSHDVHYTHPERVLPFINAFLQDNKVSSKL